MKKQYFYLLSSSKAYESFDDALMTENGDKCIAFAVDREEKISSKELESIGMNLGKLIIKKYEQRT